VRKNNVVALMEQEEVMRVVDFHEGLVLPQRPLDLVHDAHVYSECVVSLSEADDGKVLVRKLDVVFLIASEMRRRISSVASGDAEGNEVYSKASRRRGSE